MTADLLSRLRAGETTLMLGIRSSRTLDVVHIAQATGHHALMIDLEHSAMPLDTVASFCIAAGNLGLTPFVRVPEKEYGTIGRVLDGGAHGIVAPRIETVEEARQISRACRFPPRGQRSQLAMVPQLGMRPTPATELNPALDDLTIVQILLETPRGIQNADAIAELDGVDMLAIGANDLTSELGIPGQYDHPLFADAVATVALACQRHDKPLMVGGVGDLNILATLLPLGVAPLFLTGMDTDILYRAMAARATTFTEWSEKP
jgi:2-keto-3-deoxy-L-rhamnonate aldolase RhmA